MPDEDDEILRKLRVYPMFDFDWHRVDVRAFFLGEKNSNSFDCWIEAERAETLLQAEALLLFPPGGREFLLNYDVVAAVRFVTNEPRRKEVRGRRDIRKCAICGLEPPMATFATEPHLLPACTGNRFLMTTEECDSCNLTSGKATEDELGKMLTPHRALGRIQTRNKPSTKLRLGDRDSSIGGQARDAPLNISLVEGSDTVEVVDVGQNAINVKARGAPYRPISALRSLGRSAWHLLPAEVKEKHRDFLLWVRTEPSLAPARYIEVAIPGPGLRHTTFCVWAKKPAAQGPALLYLLAFGNIVLVMPSPEWMADRSKQIPIPPLPFSPYGSPQTRMITLLKDEEVTPKLSYEMRYLSRSLLSASGPAVAHAEATCGGKTVVIECELSVLPSVDVHTRCYMLRNGQLRGELIIEGQPLHVEPDGRVAGGKFQVMFGLGEDDRQGDAEITVRFVEAIANGAVLSVEVDRNTRVAVDLELLPVADFDLDALRAALRESDAGSAVPAPV